MYQLSYYYIHLFIRLEFIAVGHQEVLTTYSLTLQYAI